MKTQLWGRKCIIFSLFFMESFQKSVYKLLYFVDFWDYFVTVIFGYISCTTLSYTKLRCIRLKVLCIVIFVYVPII